MASSSDAGVARGLKISLGPHPTALEDVVFARDLSTGPSTRELDHTPRGPTRSLPVPVLGVVRRRTRLQEAWAQGRSILSLEPRSDVAQVFRELATAVERSETQALVGAQP